MSVPVPNCGSLSPSTPLTTLTGTKCASDSEIGSLPSTLEALDQPKNRSPSLGSVLENERPCQPQISREVTLPGNLKLDSLNLPMGLEKFSDKLSPQYTTTSRNTSSSPISSRESRHNRLPSLGEIHQSIEEEQEAQVNRLLHMIHIEQQHLQHLRNTRINPSACNASDEATITPQNRVSVSPARSFQNIPRSLSSRISCSSLDNSACPDLQNQNSTSSRKMTSPGPIKTIDLKEDGGTCAWTFRDEPKFYQIETQMMVRENQMLRKRINELELQINDLNTDP